MHVYLVYDKNTGRILHTVSKYILGNAEPVPMSREEVLSEVPGELEKPSVGVVPLPHGFDPRDRTRRLVVEPRTGVVTVVDIPERGSRASRSERASKRAKRAATARLRGGGK